MHHHVLLRSIACLIGFISLTLSCGCAAQQTAASNEPFADAVSGMGLDEASRIADQRDRFLIVFGTADWCRPCQHMKANAWTDARIVRWMDRNAVLYYLDVDRERPLSDELEIHSMPQVIAYLDGEEVDRLVGMRHADSFLEWLNGLGGERVARQ